MISLLQICFSVQYLKTQKTNKKAIQQLLTITTQENLRQLEYTTFLKIAQNSMRISRLFLTYIKIMILYTVN